MQDGSTSVATVDEQQPAPPVSNFVKPPETKPVEPKINAMGSPDERPVPPEPEDDKAKSKFGSTGGMARQLTVQEMNNALNVDGLDAGKVKVEEAWLTKNKDVELKLGNGDSLLVSRDADGYTSIQIPPGQAANAKTMVAMASIAESKGWKEINVRGGDEFRAMSYHAITRAGLKMMNPPDAAAIEAVREKFDAQLREPDMPKADIEVKTVVGGNKPSSPAQKADSPEKPEPPEKKKRPAASALRM